MLLAELPRVGHSNLEGGTFNAMHVHADGTFDAQIVGASRWQRKINVSRILDTNPLSVSARRRGDNDLE